MNFILSDAGFHKRLQPLSLTRSIADFRVGILTIREKWEKYLSQEVGIQTEPYLQAKYQPISDGNAGIVISAVVLPDENLALTIKKQAFTKLYKGTLLIAENLSNTSAGEVEYKGEVRVIRNLTDIFSLNGEQIKADFAILTNGRQSAEISNTNRVFGKYPLFVEEGCKIECATINTNDGPVYLAKDCEVMEGSHIRGPFALCEHATVKMAAKIYGDTTIGPWCKVGGEVSNVVFFGYSNKGHDGFLGNSVVGEWCNFGADSNNSNLKNNYAEVKLWSYETRHFEPTGLQFCGLIFGDHSKCGINTMFNTGTVVGVSANIFGSGFPRNFVPSFSWGGGNAGFTVYKLETAFEVMSRVMQRRHVVFSEIDKAIMEHIFAETEM